MDVFRQRYEDIKSKISSDRVARVFGAVKDNLNSRPLVLYGAGRMPGVFLVLSIRGGHRFTLRQHGTGYHGVVMYAV